MSAVLRLLFIGDVVGPTGRATIARLVPELRHDLRLDAVIVNGENSADEGFGITPSTMGELLQVADFITLGDHAFDRDEIAPVLESEPRIIRPANMGDGRPGCGWGTFDAAGVRIGVVNLMGRVFMQPTPESPFVAADRAVSALRQSGTSIILADLQAEATSEKQAMGWYLDGRVTAVLGTHTHVPTADLRMLPGGTAYVSDVGMTGGRDGIIGFSRDGFGRIFGLGGSEGPSDLRKSPPRPADPPARLDAVLIEVDTASGKALRLERVTREWE
jgi:metallophosphoesterase (TIGR00282 family)